MILDTELFVQKNTDLHRVGRLPPLSILKKNHLDDDLFDKTAIRG